MYKEYLLKTIKAPNTEPTYERQLIGEFYTANLNLIHSMAINQSLSSEDYYDYMQIGYEALVDTIDAYDFDSKFSFLSYFRRIFKHKIYLFNLEFRYPMRIKSYETFKTFDVEIVPFDDSAESYFLDFEYYKLNLVCYQVENELMTFSIIKVLKEELTPIQYYVIYAIYWRNRTKRMIASELGLSYNKIRNAHTKALSRLRNNKDIKRIAKDMFGIGSILC